MSNSKTIENQIICPYCQNSDASLDHDHFLSCYESGERKKVRKQSFQILLVQLKRPKKFTTLLIQGLDIAYRDRKNNSSSKPASTQ